mmetsp:Transcript_1075/g.1547  ORF Transcript_1075/g.1547 Transcript_1075/m.1547 type:complete len:406 (-) Transcript_1075:384-1601(-)
MPPATLSTWSHVCNWGIMVNTFSAKFSGIVTLSEIARQVSPCSDCSILDISSKRSIGVAGTLGFLEERGVDAVDDWVGRGIELEVANLALLVTALLLLLLTSWSRSLPLPPPPGPSRLRPLLLCFLSESRPQDDEVREIPPFFLSSPFFSSPKDLGPEGTLFCRTKAPFGASAIVRPCPSGILRKAGESEGGGRAIEEGAVAPVPLIRLGLDKEEEEEGGLLESARLGTLIKEGSFENESSSGVSSGPMDVNSLFSPRSKISKLGAAATMVLTASYSRQFPAINISDSIGMSGGNPVRLVILLRLRSKISSEPPQILNPPTEFSSFSEATSSVKRLHRTRLEPKVDSRLAETSRNNRLAQGSRPLRDVRRLAVAFKDSRFVVRPRDEKSVRPLYDKSKLRRLRRY